MKRLTFFAVMMVILAIGCAETYRFQSKLGSRMDELTYGSENKKLVEKKEGTLAIVSFVVEDVLPPDTIVNKTASFVLPLAFYNSWHFSYQVNLGYNRIANDYKKFMKESFIQEVKRSSLFSYAEKQADLTIDVTIKKVQISAPIDQTGSIVLIGYVVLTGQHIDLGPLDVDVLADVVLKIDGAVISKKKVQGWYKAIIKTPVVVVTGEYTSEMIEGLSLAIRNLNENIVRMINREAETIISPKLHSPESPITEALVTAPTPTGSVYKDPETGMEFVFVKGGCYRMGDIFGAGGSREKPVHDVCINDYYLGKYEVTEGQWKAVMGAMPSGESRGNDYPVRGVCWEDAHTFALKLKHKAGVNYRLLTEAEWEYAARDGGKDEKWPGTNTEKELREYAWYSVSKPAMQELAGTSASEEESVKAVGQKKPNKLGIYDMAGNVQEWVFDWYDGDYYKQSPKDNPKGIRWGDVKVLRGGSIHDEAVNLRTTRRDNADSMYISGDVGFRLMIEPR